MTDLHDLLERSTDRIESPDLVGRALVGARRRRTTRRAVVASVAVAAVVIGVAVAGSLGRDSDTSPPIEQPTPTPTPTVTEQVAQPTFDPANVEELPDAADDIAPVLPDTVEIPPVSPWLTDEPIGAAVLAFRGEDAVALLGTDGSWASVPIPVSADPFPGIQLSSDGTRLAIATTRGITVWVLATATKSFIPLPEDYQVAEGGNVSFQWVGSQLLLDNVVPGLGGWILDVAPSKPVGVPYPRGGVIGHAAVDDAGVVVESVVDIDFAEFVDWSDGQPRRVRFDAQLGELSSLQADAEHVAGTRFGGVVLLDRDNLSEVAVLPVRDGEGNFADGKAPVVALLEDDTVLQQVPLLGGRPGDWCLAAWSPAIGELARLTCGDTGSVPASYAVGLLD